MQRCRDGHRSGDPRRRTHGRSAAPPVRVTAAAGLSSHVPRYLAAQYQRLKARTGHSRTLGAVKHSILIAYWHIFTTGETYRDLGADYFQRRDHQRATKRLVAQLERLGHTVTLQETAA